VLQNHILLHCVVFLLQCYEWSINIEIICGELTAPDNGMITCSLGEDDTPTYQDICNYACNDGYHLNGSTTRQCEGNEFYGYWSRSEPVCIKSMSVHSM